MRSDSFRCWIATLLLLLSSAASAVDGVLEINHACAVQGGCFSGDTAGYPVTIDGSAGRSYRLTGDLLVPNANTHGIVLEAPAISLDLNGFEIRREDCDETQLTPCRPESGSGTGIIAPDPAYRGISVRNGSIVGMGQFGVWIQGDYGLVQDMRIRYNRIDGINVGFHFIVSGNVVFYNGGDGIHTTVGGIVKDNNARDNGLDGIEVGYGSTVTGNVSIGNGGNGIVGVSTGLVIIGNTAHNNKADGISSFGDARVRDNSMRNNDGYGLRLSADSAYSGNVIDDNMLGTVNGGYDMGDNFCDTNSTCP